MQPFDQYPEEGRRPTKRLTGALARHGYAHEVLRYCGYRCTYCGLDMSKFEGWLQLSIDHVIPQQMVKRGWNPEWVFDRFNVVASCRPCNDLFNRDPVLGDPPSDLSSFLTLRDRVYVDRRARIRQRRAEERRWFGKNVTPLGVARADETGAPSDTS